MTLGATLLISLLVVLARPSTWPLALATFLLRGGWLLVLVPIVVLPTPVGLANVIAPLLEDVAFGRRIGGLAALVAVTGLAVMAWLVGGGLIAAAAEAEATRRLAADDEVTGATTGTGRPGRVWRIVVVRLIAHVPLLVALGWGAIRLVSVAYRELTVPSDVTVPVGLRVVMGAPDAVVGIILAWLIGESLGALAARRVVLLDEDVPGALRGALGRFVRHPARSLALVTLSTAVLAGVLALTGIAGGASLRALRVALGFGDPSWLSIGLLVAFVTLFAGGLVLVALVAAWRSAVWTVDPAGTFGGVAGTRPGD